MLSFRLFITTAVVTLAIAPAAFGDAVPSRIRGTITAIDAGSMTIKERDGRVVTLKTGEYTAYVDVVPSSFSKIRINDFVGTAVKGLPDSMVAVEIAVFPDGTRAGRVGYYHWDPLPDPAAPNTTVRNATGMTNGRVSQVLLRVPKISNTEMANGVVSAESPTGRTLTVTYDGGSKSLRIAVPRNAPIVRCVPADSSAASLGSAVFIKTAPGDRAALVSVGKGITPPM